MKKYIFPALIIIFFIIVGFVSYNYFKNEELNNPPITDKNNSGSELLKESSTVNKSNNLVLNNSNSPVQEQSIQGSKESLINNPTSTNNTRSLPLDIESRECGFYYSDYGVCTGKCPSGNCVSEGRSCYCKNI